MTMSVQTEFNINSMNVDWSRLGVGLEPFSIEADPRFMYLSTETRRALSKVSYMVEAAQGASVVVGEVGTGKTTLASWFYSRYERRPDFTPARIEEPPKERGHLLLRRIAAEFRQDTRRATEHQMDVLRAFLTEQAEENKLPLIIIDEAHELSEEQFITLRRLLNFRDPKGGKAFQLILLGRPELDINLRAVSDFNDRVATRSSLDPLTPDDTKALIDYRLVAAGRDPKLRPLFAPDAIMPIWSETRGYPRRICFLCLHLCIDLMDSGDVQIAGSQIDASFVETFLEKNPGYRHAKPA